jgi:hypothetical protein
VPTRHRPYRPYPRSSPRCGSLRNSSGSGSAGDSAANHISQSSPKWYGATCGGRRRGSPGLPWNSYPTHRACDPGTGSAIPPISSSYRCRLICRGLADNDTHAPAAADAYAGASRPLELGLAAEDAAIAFVKQGTPKAPARRSTRRSPSTNGSAPSAISPAPTRCCARAAFAAESAGSGTGKNPLGKPDAHRTHGGRASCRRTIQSADRRAPLFTANRPEASCARIRQAGHLHPSAQLGAEVALPGRDTTAI